MMLRRHKRRNITKLDNVTPKVKPKVEVEDKKYPDIDNITKKEIIGVLKSRGADFKPYDSKAVLYGIMIEG